MAVDDHIALVDADTKDSLFIMRDIKIAFGKFALDIHAGPHRLDYTGKLHQQAVTDELDDTSAVLGDGRLYNLVPARFQAGQGAFFIGVHDGRKPVLHTVCFHQRPKKLTNQPIVTINSPG